ncbi:MAG: ATP-binding protein [Acidobacteriota bacterium]
MDSLLLPAKTVSLDAFFDFVMRKVEHLELSKEATLDIRLVLEEVVTNIAFYAYPEGAGNVEVQCWLQDGKKLCIAIIDWGIPFDPLDRPVPDLSVDVSDRPIGGMGILLVRQLADELRYIREEKTNRLQVCFNL